MLTRLAKFIRIGPIGAALTLMVGAWELANLDVELNLTNMWANVRKGFGRVTDVVSEAGKGLAEAVKGAFEGVKTFVGETMDGVLEVARTGFQSISEFTRGLFAEDKQDITLDISSLNELADLGAIQPQLDASTKVLKTFSSTMVESIKALIAVMGRSMDASLIWAETMLDAMGVVGGVAVGTVNVISDMSPCGGARIFGDGEPCGEVH